MILSRLADLLRERRRASLAELALRLECPVGALEPMLATLERKGRVRRLATGPACATSCCKCDPASVTLYEWAGDSPPG